MNQNNPFELQVCPHCCSVARFEIYNDFIVVSCSNCGCSTPRIWFDDSLDFASALEKLQDVWNVRFL